MQIRNQILIFVPILLLLTNGWTQPAGPRSERNQATHFSKSRFFYSSYNFGDSTRTKSQLYVYWGFVNDILQFIKNRENEFNAQYEMSIELLDKKQNYIDGKTIANSIIVANFEETNSDKFTNTGLVKFTVRPGEYLLRVELTDLDTQKRMTQLQKIQLNDFSSRQLACSDLIFFDNPVQHLLSGIDSPNIAANFTDSLSRPTVFFELYPQNSTEPLEFSCKIFDSNEKIVGQQIENITDKKNIISRSIDLKSQITQPGRYTIQLQLTQGKKTTGRNSHFFINWNHHNFLIHRIDDTLELLKELGNAGELDNLKDVTESEKLARLEAFWKKRDPSPETEENEIKTEFYRRLEFANQRFSVYFLDKPGWKTDRGQIYIKFGEPTMVEQQASELNRPAYEIWVYDSIHQRVIFVDRNGFGDFQLLKVE